MIVEEIKTKKLEENNNIRENFNQIFNINTISCKLTNIVKNLINYDSSMDYDEVCFKLIELKEKIVKNRNILEKHVRTCDNWRNVLSLSYDLVRFINCFICVPLTYEETSDIVLHLISEEGIISVKECLNFFAENYSNLYNRKDVVELFNSFN